MSDNTEFDHSIDRLPILFGSFDLKCNDELFVIVVVSVLLAIELNIGIRMYVQG